MMPARTVPMTTTLDWLLDGWVDPPGVPALGVTGLCHDSRAVQPGNLFFALAGSRVHGLRHGDDAVRGGACAIVYDPSGGGVELSATDFGVPCLPVPALDQALGQIADRYFGAPSTHITAFAITGTNGKTSCSHFLAHALGARASSAVIGTLGWGAPGALKPTAHTTPDAIEVHALLASLRDAGTRFVAMEASSHGLVQGRLNGVRFKAALFTNLSRDHLDYHGTMEAYLDAKLRLLDWPGLEFIAFNLDDASAEPIIARAPVRLRKIGFTLAERDRLVDFDVLRAFDVEHRADGIAFGVAYRGEQARVTTPVFGDFNVENLLGCLAVLLGLGLDLDDAVGRLRRVRPVPGRMERFAAAGRAAVVVDYAHTPDALAKTLTGLRRHCRGRLWVVFGCGGERDRGKRPQMGAIAEALADRVVVTDDNPRHEDGDGIVSEILAGCRRTDIDVIRDRRAAIASALQHAADGDVVLVAGKGHEDTQDIGGVKLPFSDRDVVQTLLSSGEPPCA